MAKEFQEKRFLHSKWIGNEYQDIPLNILNHWFNKNTTSKLSNNFQYNIKMKTMRRLISILILSFVFLGMNAQNNSAKSNISEESLKKDIENFNKTLPFKAGEGAWIWSATYANKTATLILKMNSFYQMFKENVMDNLTEEYSKALVKIFGERAPILSNNGISIKIKFLSYEDDHLVKEITLTPQKISHYYNILKNESEDKGIRPLSYYQKGFTVANANLPQKLDEYTVLFRVTMPNNIAYYDYYLDDIYAEAIASDKTGEAIAEMKAETAMTLKALIATQEMISDLKTYNIRMCYRYYYNSSKKLAFQFIVNPLTDCEK